MRTLFAGIAWVVLAGSETKAFGIPLEVFRRDDNNTAALSPPWYPTAYLNDLPSCMYSTRTCLGSYNRTADCSAIKCVYNQYPDSPCQDWDVLTDLTCLYAKINFTSCLEDCNGYSDRNSVLDWLEAAARYNTSWTGYERPYNSTIPGAPPWYSAYPIQTVPSCLTSSTACMSNSNLVFTTAQQSSCGSSWFEIRDQHCMCIATNATACLESCQSLPDRHDALNWLNDNCTPYQDWSGLPADWRSMLSVRRNETFPWPLHLTPSDPKLLAKCPPPAANLGTFAIVNVVVLALSAILGRRDIIAKLTFGIAGKVHSSAWKFLGPLGAAIQIGFTFCSALLMSKQPGFKDLNVVNVSLLWLTRPRLGWLVVLITSWNSDKAIYLSAAASALICEGILQLISLYVFGSVVNYGRKEGFYNIRANQQGQLDNVVFKKRLLMMYAGALVWLITMVFGILTLATSIYSLADEIITFPSHLGDNVAYATERRLIEKYCKTKAALEAELSRIQSRNRSFGVMAYDPRINIIEHQIQSMSRLIRNAEAVQESLSGDDAEYMRLAKRASRKKNLTDGELELARQIEERLDNLKTLILDSKSMLKDAEAGVYTTGRHNAGSDTSGEEEDVAEQDRWEMIENYWLNAGARWESIVRQREMAVSVATASKKDDGITSAVGRLTVMGMAGCWIAQWVWWSGFVGTLGNL